MWSQPRSWTGYHLPPGQEETLASSPGALNSWLAWARKTLLDLCWLLRLPCHRFWSQVCNDGLHMWLGGSCWRSSRGTRQGKLLAPHHTADQLQYTQFPGHLLYYVQHGVSVLSLQLPLAPDRAGGEAGHVLHERGHPLIYSPSHTSM